MSKDGTKALAEFLETEEGERFLKEARARSAVKAEAIEKRRALAAEREEFLRRRREFIPGLQLRVAEAEKLHEGAREAERAAQRKCSDARTAESNEHWSIREGLNRVEIALTRSAGRRLLDAVEELTGVLQAWRDTAERLLHWESHKVPVWPHKSDPDYRDMMRAATPYLMARRGTNRPGLEAMEKRIEAAREALRKLALVAEPAEEEVLRLLAEARASIAATSEAPEMVWTEPEAPRYDAQGNRTS